MTLLLWITLFAAVTALCAWIVFGNGAETMTGLALAILAGAEYDWPEPALRLFVGLGWLACAAWFVLGLTDPALRL